MATAAAPVDSAFQVPSTEYRDVSLEQLELSPLNPRKRFDPDRLAELAASMGNGVGVIAPLVVRVAAVGTSRAEVRYEIVAGARRYKAAQLAGLARVPVSVRPLSDAQVLELMVIENDQRQDITPLEEADGFARLMTFGFDFDKLAARIGRSRRYIFDSVKLLDLVDDGKALLEQGLITRAHAVLLSRETPADQQRALALTPNGSGRGDGPLFEREDTLFTPAEADAHTAARKANRYAGYKAKTVRELEAWIHAHCRFEASTPVAAELFPQTAAAVQSPDAKVVAISYAHQTHPDAKAGLTTRIYNVTSWKRADGQQRSRTCAHAVTGMVVAGAGRGESFEVCVNKDKCKTHWAADIKRREVKQKAAALKPAPAKAVSAAADKRAAAKRAKEAADQRARELARARRDQVETIAIDRALEAVVEVTPRLLRWAVVAHAGFFDAVLTARFKALTHFKGNPYQLKVKDLEKLTTPTLARALFLVTLGGVMETANPEVQFAACMKDLGVDLKAIDAAVAAEQKAAAAPTAKPTPGTCRFCGCTDDHACPGGCSWVAGDQTVCSTKACRAAWTRERATTKAAKKR